MKNTSLASFVESNHKLISALGIFTALTVFATSISLRAVAYSFSFLLLAATFLLWVELWSKFPDRSKSSLRLSLFQDITALVVLIVAVHWIISFRVFWRYFIVLPLGFAIFALLLVILSRTKPITKIVDKAIGIKGFGGFIIANVLYVLLFASSFYLAILMAEPLNSVIDQINTLLLLISGNGGCAGSISGST